MRLSWLRGVRAAGSLRDERGGVFALSAIIIPVFLLFAALVIDVGNWYTHKRQLQNRADAAALAAGVAYSKNWKACIQGDDLALKASTAREIANFARQYAADPEAADYAPDPLPSTLWNAQIADQSKLDVVINSTSFTDDTDYSDGGAGAPPPGDPCFFHAADDISAAGHWTDVKVNERDLRSLFATFGLPLANNRARARVDIRPIISASGLLPLGIPNNDIRKVQVRYYDECLDPGHTGTPLAKVDMAPLPAADQTLYAAAGGGTLWGPQSDADPEEGDKTSVGLMVRPYDPVDCGPTGLQYRPIGVQVRLTSVDSIDINGSCATLAASRFADCFSRMSQLRVHETGSPEAQPRVTNVGLTGGCSATLGDAYFGPMPVDATDCRFGAEVEVNWGSRDDDNRNISANFTVKANGVALSPPEANTPSGIWFTTGTPLIANPGPNQVTVELDWEDTDPTHNWTGACSAGGGNPCKYNGPVEPAHQTFAATRTTAGAVELVRTSQFSFASGFPGAPFDNSPGAAIPIDVFPTVATRSVLKTGILTTLRLDDPQANQTLRCDPEWTNGQEFKAFRFGCKPSYGPNKYTNPAWWYGAPKHCPPRSAFYAPNGSVPPYPTMPAPYGQNTPTNPWLCVPTAPGLSVPVIGEGLSVATENCSDPLPEDPSDSNTCKKTECFVDGNYDGKPGNPTGWFQRGGDGSDPRVVTLFIIPYQALKGSTGGDPEETVPVWGLASFYVMNWTGSNPGNSDPCPDRTFGSVRVPDPEKGSAVGVFVEAVFPDTGPVDPTAACFEGQLLPCRPVLVR